MPTPTSAAVAARITRSPLFVVLALLCATSLLPIVLVRYPPLPDLSEHLAAVSVVHNLGDPRYDLDRYYRTSLTLSPYWGYYAPVHLLAYLFGVELAGRVLLALYAITLPLGTALLARRFGRSPWLALFAFPLVWNFNFAIGFISFCVSLAILPWALVAFDRFCESPTPARAALAVGGGVLVFLADLLPWGAWLACAGIIGLLHEGRSLRSLALRATAWAAPLLLGLLVMLRGRGLHMGSVGQKGLAWKRYPTEQSLGEFAQWIWQPLPGSVDDVLVIALLALWGPLKLLSPRRVISLHGLRAEACFAVMMAAYLILPRSVLSPAYWWGVNVRFACIAALFLALTIQGDPTADLRRWLLPPLALVAAGFALKTTVDWQRAARFTAGYDELRTLPEPGSRVLFVLGEPWHDPESVFNYAHTFYGYYQTQRGGFMPWNFDLGFPLEYKVRYPSSSWREQRFDWDTMAPYYDYVFSFNHDERSLLGRHAGEARKVAQAGRWTLWRLPGPRRDDSPWQTYPNPFP